MAWLFRLIAIVAGGVAPLFVARDAMNFSFVETLVTVALIVGAVLAIVGWSMRQEA